MGYSIKMKIIPNVAFYFITLLLLLTVIQGQDDFRKDQIRNTHETISEETSEETLKSKTVGTSSGNVIGFIEKTVLRKEYYFSYRGIPYAEPPVDELRFKPPVPKEPWSESLIAKEDGPPCIQQNRNDGTVFGSEDCLFLNVYVPDTDSLKAVVVWIHGGAFTTGSGNSSYYGPDFLIEEDVIVVSIQYRVGPFGFLSYNDLDITGNAGLKDQNLALKWINDNIEFFRGDKNRITLLGQSAGGASVDYHVLSEMSSGLFQQSISMSASPLCLYWPFQSNAEAQNQAYGLSIRLGWNGKSKADLLKILMKTDAKEIILKASEMLMIPFRPTLENSEVTPNEKKFLTECSPKRYREGKYNKGKHMMGFTSNEILFLAKSLDDLMSYTKLISDNLSNKLPLNKIIKIPGEKIKNLEEKAFMKLIDVLSDIYFVTGIDKKQKLMSKTNDNPIYYYRYAFVSNYSTHQLEGIVNLNGVAHEDELALIFYRPKLGIQLELENDKIRSMRTKLVKMWSNFIKEGNPTPRGEDDPQLKIVWPDSRDGGSQLEINNDLEVKERYTNYKVKTLQNIIHLGDSFVLNDCTSNLSLMKTAKKALNILPSMSDGISRKWNTFSEKIKIENPFKK